MSSKKDEKPKNKFSKLLSIIGFSLMAPCLCFGLLSQFLQFGGLVFTYDEKSESFFPIIIVIGIIGFIITSIADKLDS